MEDTSTYPRVTRVIRVITQAWLAHWVAFEERKRMLKLFETMSLEQVRKWAKELPRCTDDTCQCAAQTVMDNGAEQGTALHKAIEAFLTNETLLDYSKALFSFPRFRRWWTKEPAEVVKLEFKVVSHVWRFKGTADALLRWPGRGLTVGDWKSSNHLSPTYWLQVALYAGGAIEMGLFTWEDLDEERAAGIFRFDKRESPYKAKDIIWLSRKQLRRCWDVACSLRRPYDFALEHDMLKVGG